MSAYQLHRPGSILFELCNFAAENSVNFINSAFKKKEAKKQKSKREVKTLECKKENKMEGREKRADKSKLANNK